MHTVRQLVIILLLACGTTFAIADPVDINSASADQISQAMVGIGKVKAAAIVQDREQKGQFKSIDDLTRIKGIKSSTVEKNRDRITVGQASMPQTATENAKK